MIVEEKNPPMIVEEKNPSVFHPITITVQTLEDLETLIAVMGAEIISILINAKNSPHNGIETDVEVMDSISFALFEKLEGIHRKYVE